MKNIEAPIHLLVTEGNFISICRGDSEPVLVTHNIYKRIPDKYFYDFNTLTGELLLDLTAKMVCTSKSRIWWVDKHGNLFHQPLVHRSEDIETHLTNQVSMHMHHLQEQYNNALELRRTKNDVYISLVTAVLSGKKPTKGSKKKWEEAKTKEMGCITRSVELAHDKLSLYEQKQPSIRINIDKIAAFWKKFPIAELPYIHIKQD